MVCLGNICRSPLAEGILRDKMIRKGFDVFIDSAGTGSWHVGENPDVRAIRTAKNYGVDISALCARQFSVRDFDSFSHIYVMDSANLRDVLALARHKEDEEKVALFLKAAGHPEIKDVPDPWYGGMEDFDNVFKLLDDACEKVAQELAKEILSSKQ